MNEKLDWKWLPQWTPTFAVLVACSRRPASVSEGRV